MKRVKFTGIKFTGIKFTGIKFTGIKENRNFSDTVDGETKTLKKFHGLGTITIRSMTKLF